MAKIKKFFMSCKKGYRSCKRRLKRYSIWDIALVKWSALFLGAIIGAYIADFVQVNISYFIIIFIILAVKPIYTFIKKF